MEEKFQRQTVFSNFYLITERGSVQDKTHYE